MLSAKVGGLAATVEGQRRGLQDAVSRIESVRLELGDKLDHISTTMDARTRTPMLPIVGLLAGAAGFLITVMGLLYNNQANQLATLQDGLNVLSEKSAAHQDGHPDWVDRVMSMQFAAVQKLFDRLDDDHRRTMTNMTVEIEKLREGSKDDDARHDVAASRLTRLEALADVIPRAFKEQLDAVESRGQLRSRDRWTRLQDDERHEGHKRNHAALEAQIGRLEQRINPQ